MAFNKYMHPRNIYRNAPDFKMLANLYPEFQQYVTCDTSGRAHVDFRNREALRAVTQTLLRHDFQLDVEIPAERLIPTLPSRLNYILWIEDLISTIPDSLRSQQGQIYGLDIGTGATCVYPLLGAKKNGWKFVATDSDEVASECAQRNVDKNGLQDSIEIVKVSPESGLTEVLNQGEKRFDFSMCNPPFFMGDEMNPCGKGRSASRPPPKTLNCPTETEAVTDGGEVALIEKMLQDSFTLQDRIKIYTSMMGKKQSLKCIKKALFQHLGKQVSSFATTEFCQGHTIRWGIAWTCIPEINLDQVKTSKRPKEIVGKPIGFEIKYSGKNPDNNLENTLETVTEILKELKISYTQLKVNRQMASLHCCALENTWSNQRRKRRALDRQAKEASSSKANVSDNGDGSDLTSSKMDVDTVNGSCNTSDGDGQHRKQDANQDALEDSQPERSPLVQYLLVLRKVHKHFALEVQWISGSLGRDGCHQVMQYLKNKLG